MATYTYYVNFNTGNDANAGTSGSPLKTVFAAHWKTALAAGDTLTVNITPGGTVPTTDSFEINNAEHGGASIVFQPTVAGTPIIMQRTGAFIALDAGLNTANTKVTFRNFQVSGAISNFLSGTADWPFVDLTFEDCTISTTNTTSKVVAFGNSAGTGQGTGATAGNLTFRRCAFTNFANQFVMPYVGNVTIDACRFETPAGVTATNDLFQMYRVAAWNVTDSQFVMKGSAYGNNGIFGGAGLLQDCATWKWRNVVFDFLGTNSLSSALISVPAMSSGTTANCAFNWDRVRIIQNNASAVACVRLGMFDDQSLQRSQILAANNCSHWGAFVMNECEIINVSNTGGGALWIGLGIGEYATASLTHCHIQNGNGTSDTSHGFNVSGNNISVSNTVSVGKLCFVSFGNNNQFTNCTGYGISSVLLFGRTGTGVWDCAQDNLAQDCLFVATSSTVGNTTYVYSDYAYNGSGYSSRMGWTNRLVRNNYFPKNGCNLANLNSLVVTTIAQAQNVAQYGTIDQSGTTPWGTRATNDQQSSVINPNFKLISIATTNGGGGRFGFQPQNPALVRTDNTYSGALAPLLQPLTYGTGAGQINSAGGKTPATLDPADVAGTPTGVVAGTPGPLAFQASGSLSAVSGAYANSYLRFEAGSANAGLALPIISYNGATNTFGFAIPWPATPAVGDTFVILGSHVP